MRGRLVNPVMNQSALNLVSDLLCKIKALMFLYRTSLTWLTKKNTPKNEHIE